MPNYFIVPFARVWKIHDTSLTKPKPGWFIILIHSQNYEKHINIGIVQILERSEEDQALHSTQIVHITIQRLYSKNYAE